MGKKGEGPSVRPGPSGERLGGLLLEFPVQDEVHRLLGLRGGQDHQASVALKVLKPPIDVAGRVVDGAVLDARLGAKEGGAHLGHELFLRVVGGAERAKVCQSRAVEALLVAGGGRGGQLSRLALESGWARVRLEAGGQGHLSRLGSIGRIGQEVWVAIAAKKGRVISPLPFQVG